MRTLALAAIALALLTFLPTPAAAQQSGNVTVTLNSPERALVAHDSVTTNGIVTLTVDYTAILGLTGIPVTYTITQAPAWATVVVSPSSDVFPAPMAPMPGLAYTVMRPITISISVADGPGADEIGVVELTAVTSAAPLGRSFAGKGVIPVSFDHVDEECHELNDAEILALAREAANEYAANGGVAAASDAPTTSASDPELHTQSTGASTLSLPWIAIVGFAIVGAGVGLLLKRRLGR